MITYSIIQKSQLEGANRLDAEYYQPEYLKLAEKIRNPKLVPLESLNVIVDASAFYPSVAESYNESNGMPFVRVADVSDLRLNEDSLVYLPGSVVDQYKSIRVGSPGDLVITKGGSVGNVAILPKKYSKYALCRDIIIVRTSSLPRKHAITILLFLGSKLGSFQFFRGASQQIQQHLTLPLARSVLVPKTAAEDAVAIFDDVFSAVEKSRQLYCQAEQMLLEELGLAEESFEDELAYVIDSDEMEEAERIDADYFQPKYKKLLSNLKAQNTKPLGEIAKRRTEKIKTLSENTYNYIEISNINVSDGEVGFMKMLNSELPTNAKIKINGGELLISKVRPTRGAVTVIPSDWSENYIASGAFSVFVTESPTREYLQIVLRSVVGEVQLGRPTTGTSYPTITDGDVEKLLIPILPQPTQQKIADLVRQSHQARKKSKELLEEAKRKVEEMIEKEG